MLKNRKRDKLSVFSFYTCINTKLNYIRYYFYLAIIHIELFDIVYNIIMWAKVSIQLQAFIMVINYFYFFFIYLN